MYPMTADAAERRATPSPAKTTWTPMQSLIQRAYQATARRNPPKQGPQGYTTEDVRAVAAGQVPGWRPGMPLPSATQMQETRKPAFNAEDVLARTIGGPAETYGEQYGGLGSQSYFDAQVKGEQANIQLARQMAEQEASRLAQPYQEAYDKAMTTGVDQTLRANEALLNAGPKKFVARAGAEPEEGKPTPGQRVYVSPLGSLARQLAGGREPTQQDLYAANMARMNAVRGTGDYATDQLAANAQEMVRRPAEQRLTAGLIASGAQNYQDIADTIGGLTPSEWMQKIATERYGYDPGLAAGLFPATEDLAYQNMLNDAEKAQMMDLYPDLNPDATLPEMILQAEGPEGLAQYQAQQVEYAMNGTPSQQLAAEKNILEAQNAEYDASVIQKYGFDPKEVSGVNADVVRNLTLDPVFADYVDQARQDIIGGADALDKSTELAQAYLEETGDNVGATALGRIIANFDVRNFG